MTLKVAAAGGTPVFACGALMKDRQYQILQGQTVPVPNPGDLLAECGDEEQLERSQAQVQFRVQTVRNELESFLETSISERGRTVVFGDHANWNKLRPAAFR